MALALLAAVADVLTPLYAGKLIDAVASGAAGDAQVWHAAMTAFWLLVALGLGAMLLRQAVYYSIIGFTLRMMNGMMSSAFHRVQRLSTDWHANSFAGSTVRKITRGMWAVDQLNDTLLIALLPSVVMVGATALLGWHWPLMGLVVGLGSVMYIAFTALLSALRGAGRAPGQRLGHAHGRRAGRRRDLQRRGQGLRRRTARGSAAGARGRQVAPHPPHLDARHAERRRAGAMLALMQVAMIGASLWLWARGQASVGDITFALTMFFMLQGYLREVGTDIRNLQRSINDMEELVTLERQPLGVADKPGAGAIRITEGEIRFDDVTFRYGAHDTPLYEHFSARIAPGERVGLVGHSGSGKTTFIKLIQRLYDVNEGRILIDGQDIAQAQQASLRRQIAIVQQEPILFHRTLAENIAYGRPGATQAEIEHAARQASAHDFIMRLPKGYDTMVGERGVKLSGGERQRVAIARLPRGRAHPDPG